MYQQIKTVLLSTILSLFSVFTVSYSATLHVNNRTISYTDSGQGIPIVFIHAFPTDQRLWDAQQPLNAYFRVITLDLWGFGQSAKVDGQAVPMVDYADEVNQLLEQLHIDKAIIAGESMGGYIALAFLGKYPDKIQGLILSDTQSIADTAETKTKRETQAVEALEQGTTNLIAGFMPKALSPNASDQTKSFLLKIVQSESATAVASALRGMALRSDASSLLANTSLPILIITGEDDILISPKQSEAMKALAKNSRLVVIKNAGHLSNLEQPEDWNRAVVEMFNK